MDELEGTQVIGWDPKAKSIRSWMFDSDGSFGQGRWTRDGDKWVIESRQVLADGQTGSAENIVTMLDGNRFTWKSTKRKVGEQLLPEMDEITIVRK